MTSAKLLRMIYIIHSYILILYLIKLKHAQLHLIYFVCYLKMLLKGCQNKKLQDYLNLLGLLNSTALKIS